ncbi:unnamed protein product [Rhizopus microsporus]
MSTTTNDAYDAQPFMELTAEWNKDPNAYLKRYYTLYYKKEDNLYVRQAPNKICVLGLLEASADSIKSIKFNTDLIGQNIKKDTVLCELTGSDDKTRSVQAFMDALTDNLDLLFNRSLDYGFLAVIMPKHENSSIQLQEYQTDI